MPKRPSRSNCPDCGGALLPTLSRVDYPHGGGSHPLQNVPVELCADCGARFLDRRVRLEIDRMLAGNDPERPAPVGPVPASAGIETAARKGRSKRRGLPRTPPR